MAEKSEKIARMAYGVNLSAMPYNGQSAAKPRIAEGSTTRPLEGRTYKRREVVSPKL